MNRAGQQTRSIRRAKARRAGLKGLAITTAAALAVFGGATGASAAPGDDANATGTFLGGSLLDAINLDAVANIDGAAATNDGVPDETVTDQNTLDLTALGAVNVTVVDGVQLPIDFASLGVLGQYASAAPDGSSIGSSGAIGEGGTIGTGDLAPGVVPGDLTLSLGDVTDALLGSAGGALVGELAEIDLTLGAVSARATQAAPGAPAGSYTIAGADLAIQSNTVAGLVGTVNGAIAPLQATVDGLQGALVDDLNDVLGLLGGVVDLDLAVGTTSLTGAVSDLLTGTITDPAYPGVALNLATGEILVDLEAISGLNGLAPGTEILSGATVQLIEDRVLGLIDGLLDDVTDELVAAVEGLTITGGATVDLGFLGTLPVLELDTSVGELLDGDTSGVELLGLPIPLPFGLDEVVAALTTPLTGLVTSIAPALDALLAPVNTLLLPALDAILPGVASLTVNNQSTSPEGVFSETAVILTVLPGISGATLELANATVGPNALDTNIDVAITAPADGDEFVVPDPDSTATVTVAGTGQPGGVITVTIPGQPDQVATVGAAPVAGEPGAWTATFADLPIGDYTATATQDLDGTTAAVAFSVAEAPDVEITAPADGEDFSVAGPTDTTSVPVSGTGSAGATVEVLVGGATETVTVETDGTWTAEFDGLGLGDYTATATQDIDGTTDAVDFSVVEAADVVVTTPEDGDEIVVDGPADLAEVTVGGTGAPNATVEVSIPGLGDSSAVVDGVTGEWEVVFTDVPVGDYTATATQDVDGSTSAVDFSVIAAADVDITAPVDGDEFLVDGPGDAIAVTVSGLGQEGETVTVEIPGQPTPAAVTVGADDTFAVTFPGLGAGTYTATATQSDGSTDTVTFSVAETADVTITAPAPDEVFGVPTAGGTADVTVSGTGQPTGVVTVTVDGVEQDATVTAGGTWTTTFEDLPVGDYTADAVQDLDGSTATVDFSVVEIADVVIATPADGSEILVDTPTSTTPVTVSGTGFEGATVTVTIGAASLTDVVDADGTWSVEFADLGTGGYTATAVQDADGSIDTSAFTVAAADDVLILSPQEDDRVLVESPGETTDVPVSGTGEIGLDVEVTIPGLGTETTTVTPFGTWSVTFGDVPEGDYTATAVQEDDSTDSVTFEVAAAEDVVITAPADDATFPVAGPDSTEDVTVTGTGEPLQTIEVTVGAEVLTTTVTPAGTWTVTFEDLPVADYTATAEQLFDGSIAEVDFAVVEIADVEITAPEGGDEFFVNGPDDTTPVVVSGTGFDGETVTVEIAGQTPQAATVADGEWTVTFAELPVADYTATATQSGDGSIATVDFSVAELADVEITAPADGDVIVVADEDSTETITVEGSGAPGQTVTVTIPGLPAVTDVVAEDGTWSVEIADVPVGTQVITATQPDGSESTVTIDVVAAADVVVQTPADGDVVTVADEGETAEVVVSGTGQPGAIITIELDGEEVGTATVTPGGDWSETLAEVPAGAHTVTATQDLDGSTSTVDFTVVEIADVEITAPGAGDEFFVNGPDDTTPVVVSGTGFDGETVTVEIAGQTPQAATVSDGEWTVTFAELPVADYTATATQSGDGSTATVDFSVAELADVAITSPEDGDVIVVADEGDTTPVVVEGSGAPGQTVTVEIPGLPVVTDVVDDDGTWSVEIPGVPEGTHEIVATQPDGSESTVTIEVVEASDVVIQTPADGDVVTVADEGETAEVVVSGTGQPGAIITIELDGDEVGTVTVGDDGSWSETLTEVPAGEHTVTATQDADGSTSTVEFAVEVITDVAITVPETGDEFLVNAPEDTTDVVISGTGYDGETVTVTVPDLPEQTAVVTDGAWSVTVPGVPVGEFTATATQSGDDSTATVDFSVADRDDVTITTPDDGEVVVVPNPGDTTEVEVCGTGQPGSEIVVTVGGLPPVTTEVDENGEWCVEVPNVPEGEHEVEAEQPEDGSETTVVIVVEEAADVTITGPTPGQEIPAIDPDATVDVDVTGTGQPGLPIVVVLDGNEDETQETVVGDDGTWTVTFPDVPAGDHEVTATQPFDESTTTVDFSVIDAVAPVDITSPADGTELNVPEEGDVLALVIAGTGEPEAEVEVAVPGITGTQTATVAEDGTWTVTFTNVGVGTYTATATQDVDGTTDTVTVSIAVAPIDTSRARADVTEQRIVRGPNMTQTVVVTGFQPGETVSGTVYSTPFDLMPAIADAAGNARLTFAVGTDFELGQHRVDIRGSLTGELPTERENTAFVVLAAGALPATGSDGSGGLLLGGAGFAFLLAGAALWMMRRRSVTE